MAVCRSDPDLPKHKGITVFVLPMDSPGVEVRPIRQMSGGTSFNEVFLTDVRVPDQNRVGDIGEGWKVALTVLGFERGSSDGSNSRVGGSWNQVRALAEHFEVTTDPIMRQKLMDLYIRYRLMGMTRMRIASQTKAGQAPGPEGSIGKIFWTQSMTAMSEVVAAILGPRLAADSGEWGTYAWNDHVLGAPGYRIAGGSDEIQRNIVGERVLGLPGEPRVDKDIPYRDVAK
jgi:alkylation response protein AidB-like acyl-CoA dehydrogenase